MFVARLLDIRVCTAAAHHSNQGKVLTEQAAVFGEGGGLFHAIPDTSCIVKPVKKKKKKDIYGEEIGFTLLIFLNGCSR